METFHLLSSVLFGIVALWELLLPIGKWLIPIYITYKAIYVIPRFAYLKELNKIYFVHENLVKAVLYDFKHNPPNEASEEAKRIIHDHLPYPVSQLLLFPLDIFTGKMARLEKEMILSTIALNKVRLQLESNWKKRYLRTLAPGETEVTVLVPMGGLGPLLEARREAGEAHGRWAEEVIHRSLPFPIFVTKTAKVRYLKLAEVREDPVP